MSRVRARHLPVFAVLLLALFGITADLSAQVNVRGRVLNDMTGEPLDGASVRLKGQAAGAITDKSGNFLLQVPDAHATIVVSYIGFTDGEVALAGRTNDIEIRLSMKAIKLDQIVAVGYGTQRRSDVTGSVVSVPSTRLESAAVTSVEQALTGAAPGVSITTSAAGAEPSIKFQIRGQNSIKASNDPLIVVDGIPYNGSMAELNPADIESVNILKDASAAAIYGSRGSNGVVLITTKKGGDGAPRFSYDGYFGTQQITNLPELMNGAEFAQFKCDRLNGGVDCENALTATELANLQAGRSTDWVKLATRTGQQQQHNLAVRGGHEGTRYYVAGSVLDVKGIARNDDFRRYTLRLNLDQRLTEWLDMGTATQLTYTDRSGLGASFPDAFQMNPLTNAYDADGKLAITPWAEDVYWNNPLEGLLVADEDITRRVFTSSFVQLDAPFLPGLSYRFNGGIDYGDGHSGRYYGRNTRTGLELRGRATVRDDMRFDWTAENMLRFQRVFGPHSIDLTALYSRQENRTEGNQLRGEGFPNDVLTWYQANVASLLVPSQSYSKQSLISQMGRINYNLLDRYLLTITARRDGYSGFGENHKYGVFPSVAFGWTISNEPFFQNVSAIDNLKLRLSWGRNGNQAISAYQTLARLDDLSYLDGEQTAPGYIPVSLGNPNLKWETTTSINAGIDFGAFHNRVVGSLDVYSTETKDLLLDRLVSPVHGITRIVENIGQTANKGIELQLTTRNIERDKFSWTTDFNIAANRNEIVDLYGDGTDDVLNGWFIGHPIDVSYGYKFDGVWQEGDDIANSAQPTAKPGDVRIKDISGPDGVPDGKIDATYDRTFLGNLQPDYTAALNNTFRYGNFTLSALLTTTQGVVRSNALLGTNLVHNEVRLNTVKREYWTPENRSNSVPANSNTSNPMSVGFYEDASFIRLKDVTLSWDLPESLRDRFGGRSMRIYLNGRNLWTLTDWTGLDPELSNQRGTPLERVIVGGVNVQF